VPGTAFGQAVATLLHPLPAFGEREG